MKDLRVIRIILTSIFFAGAVVFLTSPAFIPALKIAEGVQIIPSLAAGAMGTILIWLGLTLLFGRVYCSSVCPVGTLQDIFIPLRRKIPFLRHGFSYRPPRPYRYPILLIYVLCLLLGVLAVQYWIEPWNIMRNICGAFNPSKGEEVWMTFGVGIGVGMASGIVSGLLIIVCAVLTGRGFCTEICPIGTALGCLDGLTLYHIEIDPDRCINCMKCEEICKSQCVKVLGRKVDNSRCVRCFDCLKVCPNDAIRFQVNRNRRATPLIHKVKEQI